MTVRRVFGVVCLGFGFLFGCSNKDDTLIGGLPLFAPRANVSARIFAENNDLQAYMANPQALYGFGNDRSFFTADTFKTYAFLDGDILPNTAFWAPPNITTWGLEGATLRVWFSDADGQNQLDTLRVPARVGGIARSYTDVSGWLRDSIRILATESDIPGQNPGSTRAAVYTQASDTVVTTWVSEVGELALDIAIASEEVGYVLTQRTDNNQRRLYQALINGQFSDRPIDLPPDASPTRLVASTDGRVALLASENTDVFRVSQDGGQSFTSLTGLRTVLDVSWVANDSGFALVEAGFSNVDGPLRTLYQTADGGLSWSPISEPELNATRIQFVNNRWGLAHSGTNLYVTFDGGRTWQLRVYPYPR